MRRFFLSLSVLAAVVTGVALAQARPEAPVAPSASSESGTLSISIGEPLMVRVDAKYIVPALGAVVVAPRNQGQVQDMVLRFAVERAEVLKLRPPDFGVEIDNVALLTMSPDRPVYIEAQARPEFLAAVRAWMEGGGTLEGMALDKGTTGYPALFDLENYTFKAILQEGGVQ